MNTHLKRLTVTLLLGVVLLCSASCGKSESFLPFGGKKSASEKAYESLASQFEELKATVTGSKASAEQATFWQAIAALFIVLSVLALIGGAALGSRARLARERFLQSSIPDNTHTPEKPKP